MPAIRDLLTRRLRQPAYSRRYDRRRADYPRIAELVPERVSDVVNDRPPWYCHGLAWRLATWESESQLARFDALLGLVEHASGWQREWQQNWVPQKLANYDHFFHLLWMLQCHEHFKQVGVQVEFLAGNEAAPDLKVTPAGRRCILC